MHEVAPNAVNTAVAIDAMIWTTNLTLVTKTGVWVWRSKYKNNPHKNNSLYTEPELLVGVIPSDDVEADEAGQEGDDFMAGDFWEADKLV